MLFYYAVLTRFFNILNCFVGFVLPMFNICCVSSSIFVSLTGSLTFLVSIVSLHIRHLFAAGPLLLSHFEHRFG